MKNILVAVDGTPFSDEVVKLACQLAKLDKAKLFIVYVYEVPRTLPLEAEISDELEKGDKILDRASEISEEYNLDVETDLVHARSACTGIVEESKDLGVDLIVIGMGHKIRFGELFGGSTVSYVLKNSPCKVILLKETLK